jgi:hypothetical protein
MDRAQTLDSPLNIKEQTSPSAPRRPKPSINGHADHRDADFGEDTRVEDTRVED